ncbi:MAG: malate dehydrogenase (oxaloacetate-decarboxylating) [Limisphaerales bacterium]|jgi:malate dehydrogenase (oxaloacetate-decarboxylating)
MMRRQFELRVGMSSQPRFFATSKRGLEVLQDPLLNKGSAFTLAEREMLDLQGHLPPHVSTPEEQLQRAYAAVTSSDDPLERYVELLALQDRNEHLYYRLLTENMAEFMPIVYTPTVGLACERYSHVFQRARGVWIDPSMRGNMANVLQKLKIDHPVRLIVATDNESILGIGDQGAGGMAISVGKLALYVAGAGLHPGETLPVSLDVGTNNQALLDDDLYLGWRHRRLEGDDYISFIDEFVEAVCKVFPGTLLQWEDFRKDNAVSILARHRSTLLSFNDDVQGTGAVTLAGIYSALKISGAQWSEQRVVIHGAGAAGAGIANQIRVAMRMAGLSDADVQERIAILDSRGLLVDDQEIRDSYKLDLAWPLEVASRHGLADPTQRDLESVVDAYKPTILIGSSGQPGAFTEEIVRSLLDNCERPIVLPFSNPTSLSEAKPEDVIRWTDGRALVATGSPFAPVEFNGKTFVIGQGNNVFIFPGLGLGALLAKSVSVTDEMVTVAAQACAEAMTDEELAKGMLYPAIERLRSVSAHVARNVAMAAVDQGISNVHPDQIDASLADDLWDPHYPEITIE